MITHHILRHMNGLHRSGHLRGSLLDNLSMLYLDLLIYLSKLWLLLVCIVHDIGNLGRILPKCGNLDLLVLKVLVSALILFEDIAIYYLQLSS